MATSEDQARRAKSLLEIHVKNQETLARTERRLQKVQNDISAVQVITCLLTWHEKLEKIK